MTVAAGELSDLVTEIFKTMLGVELEEAHGDAALEDASVLTGTVGISGDWEGAVTVECGEALARRIAGIMLGIRADEVQEQDVRDSLGEVANMTGGNVKALFPGSSRLSLPAVVTDSDASVNGLELVERVGFRSGDHGVVVSVFGSAAMQEQSR